MEQRTSNKGRGTAQQLRLVRKVAECYGKVVNAMPVCAVNLDADDEPSSHKWSPAIAESKIDVEHAVEAAIRDRDDRPQLKLAWNKLLVDDSVIDGDGMKLVHLLAPVFRARELEPFIYFRPARRAA